MAWGPSLACSPQAGVKKSLPVKPKSLREKQDFLIVEIGNSAHHSRYVYFICAKQTVLAGERQYKVG